MSNLRFNLLEKLVIYLSGVWPIMSVIFLITGPLLFHLGGSKSVFEDLRFQYEEVVEEWGYITEIIEPGKGLVTDKHQFNYTFPVGLETIYGTTFRFTSNTEYQLDQKVKVEYIKNKPEISRIEGQKLASNSIMAYSGIVLVIVSIVYILFRMRWLKKRLHAFQNGGVALATFDSMTRTGVVIYDEEEYEMSYRYTVDEVPYFYRAKSIDATRWEKTMLLFYSQEDHKEVTPVSRMPKLIGRKISNMKTSNA